MFYSRINPAKEMFDGNVALVLKSFTNRLVKLSCTLSVFLVLINLNDIHHNFFGWIKTACFGGIWT